MNVLYELMEEDSPGLIKRGITNAGVVTVKGSRDHKGYVVAKNFKPVYSGTSEEIAFMLYTRIFQELRDESANMSKLSAH